MPIPLVSPEQMRRWEDATWKAGISEREVIARVGEALAGWIRCRLPARARLLVVAGKGHNGDDGRAAFEALGGREARLVEILDPAGGLEDLEQALLEEPDAIVDCLFGIGLDRPVEGGWRRAIEAINASAALRLSVDVPSGLHAGTGEALGAAVRADYTLAVAAAKTGTMAARAASHAGYVRILEDVGLVPWQGDHPVRFSSASDFAGALPRRPPFSHKYDFGHLAIVAGSPGYHGAAILAARGASRARPGLVTLLVHEGCYLPVASQLQQAMVRPWSGEGWPLERIGAVLVGPGLACGELPGSWKRSANALWKKAPHPVVADASALDWLEPGPAGGGLRVITPHAGEAARMLGVSSREAEGDRLGALRALSARYGGCHVVLKGAHTLVGSREGPVYANATGDPGLAQAGSGDVLAGFLAGLLAQPSLQEDAALTLRLGVWRHGEAAERLGRERSSWTVEELPQALLA